MMIGIHMMMIMIYSVFIGIHMITIKVWPMLGLHMIRKNLP